MKTGFVLTISIIAFVSLIFIVLFISGPDIEQDLTERSIKALKSDGITFDNIYFDGQQAILKGTVNSQQEKDQIEEIVSNVYGVSSVSNLLLTKDFLAIIIKAEGETTIKNSLSGKIKQAVNGTNLIDGDKITTSKNGRVSIKFLDDNNLIRIRPNSSCSINSKKEKESIMKNIFVEVGSFFSRIISKESSFRVSTPTSVASVKGTSYWTIQEFNGITSFFGIEGVIEVSNNAGVALVKEGERCLVSSKNSKLIVEKIDLEKIFNDTFADVRIVFNHNSIRLNENYYNILNRIKEFTDQYPFAFLDIHGYTDDSGSSIANLKLSEERANAVAEYLITKGIDPEIINVIGYGEKRPIASNNNPLGRQKNRRVEIRIKENK